MKLTSVRGKMSVTSTSEIVFVKVRHRWFWPDEVVVSYDSGNGVTEHRLVQGDKMSVSHNVDLDLNGAFLQEDKA